MITIRQLDPNDAAIFQQVRLQALQNAPEAFGSSYEEEKDRSLDTVASRLDPADPHRATFAAFAGEQAVGLTGIYREDRLKTRHKAMIWGVFVNPDFRGQGIAQQLIETAIDRARTWEGVQQIQLAVVLQNQSAYRLYRRLGFVTWGIEPAALLWQGQALDEAYMVLKL